MGTLLNSKVFFCEFLIINISLTKASRNCAEQIQKKFRILFTCVFFLGIIHKKGKKAACELFSRKRDVKSADLSASHRMIFPALPAKRGLTGDYGGFYAGYFRDCTQSAS